MWTPNFGQTSQLGGLPIHHSATYCKTVHERFYIKDDDSIFSDTNSPHIQKDVIRLLSFSDSKFANAIKADSSNDSSKLAISVTYCSITYLCLTQL